MQKQSTGTRRHLLYIFIAPNQQENLLTTNIHYDFVRNTRKRENNKEKTNHHQSEFNLHTGNWHFIEQMPDEFGK